jgi:hypothetical protein
LESVDHIIAIDPEDNLSWIVKLNPSRSKAPQECYYIYLIPAISEILDPRLEKSSSLFKRHHRDL